MKKIALVLLSVFFAATLFAFAAPAKAAGIFPDLLGVSFDENGTAFNFVTGSDLEKNDPDKTPVTVYDKTASAYFLRTSTEDPTNYFISKEATNLIRSKFNTKQQDPDSGIDPSFTWEFMVRVPEMPNAMRYGSGYYASGGLSFTADADHGYFKICSGTSDSNAKDYFLQFAMEANRWYHCILIYDDPEQQFYAYVNGERITTADGKDHVDVNPFRFSYLWHWGMTVGGGNIEDKKVVLSQDVAIFNVYSRSITEDEAIDIYYNAADLWGISDESDSTPTPEVTKAPTATPKPTQQPPTPGITQAPVTTNEPTAETTAVPTSEPTPETTADITTAPTEAPVVNSTVPTSNSDMQTPGGNAATMAVDNTPAPATTAPSPKNGISSGVIIIVAIIAGALAIGSGIAAGIIVTKKK